MGCIVIFFLSESFEEYNLVLGPFTKPTSGFTKTSHDLPSPIGIFSYFGNINTLYEKPIGMPSRWTSIDVFKLKTYTSICF